MRLYNHNTLIKRVFLIFIFLFPLIAFAQEKKESASKPETEFVEGTFHNLVLINNQTTDILEKKEIEFSFQQRFGNIRNDIDMFGIYAISNLRLGLDYGITDRISIGAGISRCNHTGDLNLKILMFRQNKSGAMPVTVAYFGEVTRNGSAHDDFINDKGEYDPVDRISYFHELLMSRKFTERLTLQGAVTYSYFNFTEAEKNNGNLGLSFLGRYKICRETSVILDFDYPITQPEKKSIKPNLGIGLEFAAKNNQVQIFITTSSALVNDELRVSTQNDFTKTEFLLGFNISRKWDLKSK